MRNLLILIAIAMTPAFMSDAFALKVKKVDDYRYKCTWSDGSFTSTTAGSKDEARANCNAAKPSNNVTLSDVTEEAALEAVPMEKEK